MCVLVYVSMYLCMFALYTCYVCIYMDVSETVSRHRYGHLCMCLCVCACTNVGKCVCVLIERTVGSEVEERREYLCDYGPLDILGGLSVFLLFLATHLHLSRMHSLALPFPSPAALLPRWLSGQHTLDLAWLGLAWLFEAGGS